MAKSRCHPPGVFWLLLVVFMLALTVVSALKADIVNWQIEPLKDASSARAAMTAVTFDSQDRAHAIFVSGVDGVYAAQPPQGWVTYAYPERLAVSSYYSSAAPPTAVDIAAGNGRVLSIFSVQDRPGGKSDVIQFVGSGDYGTDNWFCSPNWPATRLCALRFVRFRVTRSDWCRTLLAENTCSYSEYPMGWFLVRTDDDFDVASAIQIDRAVSSPPTLASDLSLGWGSDGAVDREGNLHAVRTLFAGTWQVIQYAYSPLDGPFTVEEIDRGWWEKTGPPSLALDDDKMPHIVYTVLWPYYELRHAYFDGLTWHVETVDGGGTPDGWIGTFPDIVFDKSGTPHIIYVDGLHGLIKHAWLEDGAWLTEPVDTVGTQQDYGNYVGYVSAAVDSRGGIGIAYWDSDDALFKYAYLPIPEPVSAGLLLWGLAVVAMVGRPKRLMASQSEN